MIGKLARGMWAGWVAWVIAHCHKAGLMGPPWELF